MKLKCFGHSNDYLFWTLKTEQENPKLFKLP